MSLPVIQVTGALWYAAETAIIGQNNIRVFNFGYNYYTVCKDSNNQIYECSYVINLARTGQAIVYVDINTPAYVDRFEQDRTPLALAFALSIGAAAALMTFGKDE